MTLWSPCVLYYNIHTWKMLWRLDLLEYKYTYTYTQTTTKWLPCVHVCQHYTCTACIITHDYYQAEYLLLVATQASKACFPNAWLSTQLALCTCCISAKPTSQFAVHVLSFTYMYMCIHTIQSPCNHMLFTNTCPWVTVARIVKNIFTKSWRYVTHSTMCSFPSGAPEWKHNYTTHFL